MKRFVLLSLLCLMILGTAALAERGTAGIVISEKKIEIEYGRPTLNGRDMISKLPVGGTWRMGMNDATTLKTEGTLIFGEKSVKPGTYRLTAKRVEESKWFLLLTSDDGTEEVPLMNGKVEEPVEQFTISLDSVGGNKGVFSMAWGKLNVGTQFSVN
jgi:hypothetical protein